MSGIGVKEVAFIGYPVTDFERAREFYGDLLGLEEGARFEQDGKIHWLEYEVAGVAIGLGPAGPQWEPGPQGGGMCLEVEDLEGALERLESAGVKIAFPIQDYPICRLAGIEDPDGNGIALHQKKPNHPDNQ